MDKLQSPFFNKVDTKLFWPHPDQEESCQAKAPDIQFTKDNIAVKLFDRIGHSRTRHNTGSS